MDLVLQYMTQNHKSLELTIQVFWWEGTLSHIWHNRSDRLSVAFLFVQKKNCTVQVEAKRPDI